MFYPHGQIRALQQLGIKEAGWLDKLLRRAARGRSLVRTVGHLSNATPALAQTEKPLGHRIFRALIGEPEQLLKRPFGLIRDAASLRPTREAVEAIRGIGPEGPGLWSRTKGVGHLAGDLTSKGFLFGIPGYTIHKTMTEGPEPGSTRGEQIGEAVGEGLGWLPPTGLLGFVAPEYGLPGAMGHLGKYVGGGIGRAMGEPPALPIPLPSSPPVQDPYNDPNAYNPLENPNR